MPSLRVTPIQRALLVQMADDSIVCGTLGKDPLSPNHRIFETSDGKLVERNTAVSLLRRGMLRVVSVDGPRNYLTVTELGRVAVRSSAPPVPRFASSPDRQPSER